MKDSDFDIVNFFKDPVTPRQRQYEAVRAVIVDGETVENVAERFGYKVSTVCSLLRAARSGKVELFPVLKKEPRKKQTDTEIRNKIIAYRKRRLSTPDIQNRLAEDGIKLSARTVERILKSAGFPKLKRRTFRELGKTKKAFFLPDCSGCLDIRNLAPFRIDFPVAGVFYFIPHIVRLGVGEAFYHSESSGSSPLPHRQIFLAMLLLKLIGRKKVKALKKDYKNPGFGIFAGLGGLPDKPDIPRLILTLPQSSLEKFLESTVRSFQKNTPGFLDTPFFELDFYPVEKKGGGAHALFVYNSSHNFFVYAGIRDARGRERQEINKLITLLRQLNGKIRQTFVFDGKFIGSGMMEELEKENLKFISLRRRSARLINGAHAIPSSNWEKIVVPMPGQKKRKVLIYENHVELKNSIKSFRQIIVKNDSLRKPEFIITNNDALSVGEILEIYLKRWHTDRKIEARFDFFNLIEPSLEGEKPICIDAMWTVVADQLYHMFAMDLNKALPHISPTVFQKYIDVPGSVVYDGSKFVIKIKKRSHGHTLKKVECLQTPVQVPWLSGKTVEFVWTA